MTTVKLDYRGLRCPQPTLKLGVELRRNVKPGDLIEVIADCPSFEIDVHRFCETFRRALVSYRTVGDLKIACIKA